jgi:hypothetical protein
MPSIRLAYQVYEKYDRKLRAMGTALIAALAIAGTHRRLAEYRSRS